MRVTEQAQYPGLLENFPAFASEAEAKRVAVFLDYDGTLTPIVKNPDRAFMSDQVINCLGDHHLPQCRFQS